MKKIVLLLLTIIYIFAYRIKTLSDVYSYAMLLYLRKKAGIKKPFPVVLVQHNKLPRHVIQKALEILNKINTYRITHNYGTIFVPPYPASKITPSDVYEKVKRVDAEVIPFIEGYTNEFMQVILNLISNVKDAIEEKRKKEKIEGIIEVSNEIKNGGGIPDEIKEKRLYMAKEIIERSNGKIRFEVNPLYTTFIIKLKEDNESW